VKCTLPGTPDFRQGFAGLSQPRHGAAGEGGLSPDIVCDGKKRLYTGSVSSITGSPFRRGFAVASASVNVCNNVGDQQVCANGSASRRVLVWSPRHTEPAPPPPVSDN
jgi:hypothetical protein